MAQPVSSNHTKPSQPLSTIEVPAELIEQYDNSRKIRSIQGYYAFYIDYFNHVCDIFPKTSHIVPIPFPDLTVTGERKTMELRTLYTWKTVFKGLIASPLDKKAEQIAANEAYTRVFEDEDEDTKYYRFFLAADVISFYKGPMHEEEQKGPMRKGKWVHEGSLNPISEPDKLRSYLIDCLKTDGLWIEELEAQQRVRG